MSKLLNKVMLYDVKMDKGKDYKSVYVKPVDLINIKKLQKITLVDMFKHKQYQVNVSDIYEVFGIKDLNTTSHINTEVNKGIDKVSLNKRYKVIAIKQAQTLKDKYTEAVQESVMRKGLIYTTTKSVY